ncbi:EspA/EspE family type VII secretion system effector [Mycobacterium syngnathidarum]
MGDFGDIYDAANNWYSGYGHVKGVGGDDAAYNFAGLGANVISVGQEFAKQGAKQFDNAKFLAAATTRIIATGLRAMTIMSNMTGAEGPERGDRYGAGADAFSDVGSALETTRSPNSWQGNSSDAYGDRNDEQRQRAELMASTDREVQKTLDAEADQIKDTRQQIDHQMTELTLMIPVALAARLWNVPPGSGMIASMLIECAAVAKTVPIATQRMYRMTSDSAHNATVIRRAGATYDRIASQAQAQ